MFLLSRGLRRVGAHLPHPGTLCNVVSISQNDFHSSLNDCSDLLPSELEPEVQTLQSGMENRSPSGPCPPPGGQLFVLTGLGPPHFLPVVWRKYYNCIPPHSLKRPASTVNHAVALTFSSAHLRLPNEAWFVVFREGPELSHLLSPLAVPSARSDQPPSQPQACIKIKMRY